MVLTGTPYSFDNRNANHVFASERTETELPESEMTESDMTEEFSDSEEESETQPISETETNET